MADRSSPRRWAVVAWLLATSASGAAVTWERAPGLVDVRHAASRDLTDPVRRGPTLVPLAHAVVVAGRRWDALVVEPGAVTLSRRSARATLDLDGFLRPGDGLPRGPRYELLAGPAVAIAPDGLVRFRSTVQGAAIRFTALSVPGGTAAVELLLDRRGTVTLQYLALPSATVDALRDGSLRAGVVLGDGRRSDVLPGPATGFLMRQPGLVVRPPGPGLPRPAGNGPAPPGCDPLGGTWCDQADGPGSALVFLNETFDDGGSAARGWAGTDLWHEVAFATCSPGASGDPGRSWYHGNDATCTYDNRDDGTLTSPPIGPVTANTQLFFTTRLAKEDFPVTFDTAEVLVNGTPIGQYNSPPDPNAWYSIVPLDLGAWAGQVVTIGWRFRSDNSSTDLGWFVDDVLVWDENGANADCVINAGRQGTTPCSERETDQWSFNEGDYCQGCSYTFYVLVECGREMHLPLDDMEGADVQVTDVLTGLPVSLRCVNETARADAGEGSHPARIQAECCADPGLETWWGPPLDETDGAGPGHVSWGFPSCASLADLDTDGDGVECAELPGCGGQIDAISPGEEQVVDCFIQDDAGLCGLFRVDVISGGFVWDLFANCDGTNAPQFRIFLDCTEAWAAWNPLPELAVANLTTVGACPDVEVSFEIANLGCTDQAGDVPVRIVTDCGDSLDHVVAGPIPANGSVADTVTITASCSPVRIEVLADPDDVIAECTESPTVAACRAEAGIDSLATFTCGCTANLSADAGPDVAACEGEPIALDASLSVAAPCATPEYRWLDAAGAEVRPWSADPTLPAVVGACPGGTEYRVELRCQGEACVDVDTVRVDCLLPTADAGADVTACAGDLVLLDASASAVAGCAQPEYRWLDDAGLEVRGWTADPTLGLADLDCADAGTYRAEVRCTTGGTCSATDDVVVGCVAVVAEIVPDTMAACEGEPIVLGPPDVGATATGCALVEFRWLDGATGAELRPWDPDPALPPGLALSGCPGSALLVLEARCSDGGIPTCTTFDAIQIDCPAPTPPAPTATDRCGAPAADLACGVAEPGVTHAWDLDTSADSDGDGDPADDQDALGCDVTATWPAAGTRTVRAWALEPTRGCATWADLDVTVQHDPALPAPDAVPACPGSPTSLRCGAAAPGATYAWDADVAADSDGNGSPDDDVDATGCDVAVPYAEGSHVARVTATDAFGCTSSAEVRVDVTPGTAPEEVAGLRLQREGDGVRAVWAAAAGAVGYRALAGPLASLLDDRAYDHGADDPAGRGACAVTGESWSDADAGVDGEDHYFLIVAFNACGREGPTGAGRDARGPVDRPARTPTADCP